MQEVARNSAADPVPKHTSSGGGDSWKILQPSIKLDFKEGKKAEKLLNRGWRVKAVRVELICKNDLMLVFCYIDMNFANIYICSHV